jgi:hypothetical protein
MRLGHQVSDLPLPVESNIQEAMVSPELPTSTTSPVLPGVESQELPVRKKAGCPSSKGLSKTKRMMRRRARRHSALMRGKPKPSSGRTGRPLKILTSPEQMARIGDEYFAKTKFPCFAGLITWLGLNDYTHFYAYMDRAEFHDTCRRLYTTVMAKMEQVSIYNNSAGARHALNNFSRWNGRENGVWRNETDVNVSVPEPTRQAHAAFRDLPKELQDKYVAVLKEIDDHRRISQSKATTAKEIHPTSLGSLSISSAVSEEESCE